MLLFDSPYSHFCRCANAGDRSKAGRSTAFVKEWSDIYLKEAQHRLQRQIDGYALTIEDVYTMQQMCAYEVSSAYYYHHLQPMLTTIADRSHRLFQVLWFVH
jgi:hypothetical protein